MGGPHPLTAPRNTYKTRGAQKSPRQSRGLEPPDPPPKTDFITPDVDSTKQQPLPALVGCMKHQMPSPRTQVQVESKEDNSLPWPCKANFASKGPSRVSGLILQPKEPRADVSFIWGRSLGLEKRSPPLWGWGASPGTRSFLSLQHSLTITLSLPATHSHPSTAPSY